MRDYKKKGREERERLSHEINVEVEHHERDVEVHDNDEEMRNVEDVRVGPYSPPSEIVSVLHIHS